MATCSGAGRLVRQFSTSSVRNKLADLPLRLYGVEGRYATALYSAAVKSNKLDVVEKEMNAIQGYVKTDKKFATFLHDPVIKANVKKDALTALMKKQQFSDVTTNFFGVMSENGRLPKTSGILTAFGRMMSAHKGELECTVTVAKPLDKKDETELMAALAGFAKSGSKMKTDIVVDPSILGGMIVNIGDKFVDMSTASKMKKYSKAIKDSF